MTTYTHRHTSTKLLSALLIIGLLAGVTACKTSRQVSAKHVDTSGFLGDYSQLEPGAKGQAALIYINSGADWRNYTKVKIAPVELWHSDDPASPMGKLSTEDKQMLVRRGQGSPLVFFKNFRGASPASPLKHAGEAFSGSFYSGAHLRGWVCSDSLK